MKRLETCNPLRGSCKYEGGGGFDYVKAEGGEGGWMRTGMPEKARRGQLRARWKGLANGKQLPTSDVEEETRAWKAVRRRYLTILPLEARIH